MLDRLQFQVLISCADDYELFFFPFKEANLGTDLFPDDPVEDLGRPEDGRGSHAVPVPGRVVAAALDALVRSGLLSWRPCVTDRDREGLFLTSPMPSEELRAYDDYACPTYEDHIERYGYGPHEFYITRQGIEEIDRPQYDSFRKE